MSRLFEWVNRIQMFKLLILTAVLILIIGIVDFITGPEFSFSIFYIIVIVVLSLNRKTHSSSILFSSILASMVWFIAEYASRHYSNIFFPIWNAFVRFTTFTAIGLLIYYLKKKHSELKEVNINLESLNEEKNELIGIAAHDLRNPIGGINAFSDIVLQNHRNSLKPDMLEAVEYIHSLSGYSLSMLEKLLDISKIEAGKFNLKKESHDYIDFIKHHIAVNEIIAKNKKISIHLVTNLYGYILSFDKSYLGEVIDNLLSNSIKFSKIKSKIIVKVSVSEELNILTEVVDFGIGIKEEEQKKLFNYFHTTSTQPTAGEKSTGLGLAIAKKIVCLHNGKIGVKSIFGEGSTFYYTIPLGHDGQSNGPQS